MRSSFTTAPYLLGETLQTGNQAFISNRFTIITIVATAQTNQGDDCAMEDRDWLIIKVLHEQKNITKTAQTLFLSQPALTARIRQIEAELDTKIIYRGSRGIHFTPEGDYLARCAESMIDNMRQIKEQLGHMGSTVKGILRIAAPNYITQYKLSGLLGQFREQYPKVEFNISNAWSREICSLLYSQDVHIGFVRTDHDWRGEKRLLHQEPICIVSKQEVSFRELPTLPRIDYITDFSYKTFLNAWWNDNFSQPPRVSMTVSQLSISKAMVMNGLGYAILPVTILSDVPHLHKIPLLNREGQQITRPTWMLYQKEILELKMARLFIDFATTVDFDQLS